MIYKNVEVGKNATIGENVLIGVPPRNKKEGELKTIIGDNAIIRSHTVIYAGNIIGNNFQTGHHANIRESNVIGNNVSIGTLSVVEHHVKIEDNVRIHTQAFIPEFSILKNKCWIGPNVVLTNALFPTSNLVKETLKGPIINENARIGANSTILPGIVIGKNSLVGAGAVVTKDIDENVIVVGNPAKVIKKINDLKYNNGEKVY